MVNVGLNYLNLSRSAETLSGGEAQRIRLASQIGAGLVGVMYVLDEPSIGLHQRFGFSITGQMPQVGRKFGRWLDLTFMQLILTPERSAP